MKKRKELQREEGVSRWEQVEVDKNVRDVSPDQLKKTFSK